MDEVPETRSRRVQLSLTPTELVALRYFAARQKRPMTSLLEGLVDRRKLARLVDKYRELQPAR